MADQNVPRYQHINVADFELSILFAASAFRKLSSIYVFSYIPFGFEGRIWDLIVSVPDHCLSFYFVNFFLNSGLYIMEGERCAFYNWWGDVVMAVLIYYLSAIIHNSI